MGKIESWKIRFCFHVFLMVMVACTLICGCSSSHYSLIPSDFNLVNTYNHTVSVNVVGEWRAGFWNGFELSNKEYTDALNSSIKDSGIFLLADDNKQGEYFLEVYLQNHKEPVAGLDMTVIIETEWILKKYGSQKILCRRELSSPCTVKVSEAIVGYDRYKKARAGAIRKSIKDGIESLSHDISIE